jgi:hypothetical protein
MCGAIPLPPYVFTAWCSVKQRRDIFTCSSDSGDLLTPFWEICSVHVIYHYQWGFKTGLNAFVKYTYSVGVYISAFFYNSSHCFIFHLHFTHFHCHNFSGNTRGSLASVDNVMFASVSRRDVESRLSMITYDVYNTRDRLCLHYRWLIIEIFYTEWSESHATLACESIRSVWRSFWRQCSSLETGL